MSTNDSANKQALIVFAKIPEAGKVKTRLTTLLSPEDAARLYRAFLEDALDLYVSLGFDVRLYLGPSDLVVPDYLHRDGVTLHTQKGADLGARMAAAFAESFIAGYGEIVIIGTDHPTLAPAFIEHAFNLLEESGSICIGPSEDGGYYLLGMNSFYPQLFQGMTYSHNQVFTDTLDRAEAIGVNLSILPEWYDVDEPESLIRLNGEINSAENTLSNTRKVLSELRQSYLELEN